MESVSMCGGGCPGFSDPIVNVYNYRDRRAREAMSESIRF